MRRSTSLVFDWLRRVIAPSQSLQETRRILVASSPMLESRNAEAIYFDVAMKKLNDQLADVKSIDQAFYSYFSIGSTILPITAGFISSADNAIQDSAVAKLALRAAFLFYLAMFVVLVWTVRISKWDSRPLLSQWREVTAGSTEEAMQRWLGDACVAAYANNEPVLERRGEAIWLGLVVSGW